MSKSPSKNSVWTSKFDNIILEILSREEYNAKSLYLELKKRGIRASYWRVHRRLRELLGKGLVLRSRRGWYRAIIPVKETSKTVTESSKSPSKTSKSPSKTSKTVTESSKSPDSLGVGGGDMFFSLAGNDSKSNCKNLAEDGESNNNDKDKDNVVVVLRSTTTTNNIYRLNYVTSVRVNRDVWRAFKEFCGRNYLPVSKFLNLVLLSVVTGRVVKTDRVVVQPPIFNINIASARAEARHRDIFDDLRLDVIRDDFHSLREKYDFVRELVDAWRRGRHVYLLDGTALKPTAKYIRFEAKKLLDSLNAFIRKYGKKIPREMRDKIREMRSYAKKLAAGGQYAEC